MSREQMDTLQDLVVSALDKLKAAKDEGPGGTVELTNAEATVIYRVLTEQMGVTHPGKAN
jgi:hypothetical protein